MMLPFILLAAQNVHAEKAAAGASVAPAFPVAWPHQIDLLTRCQEMSPGIAALLILAGVIYLLFGFKIFKALVMLNAAAIGGYVAAVMYGGHGEQTAAAVLICAFAAAALAWPTMKYAVAIMGGLFGAALGGSLWKLLLPEQNLLWAGALMGLVAFGLLSFVLFKASVMMYTSLQGSFMLVFGCLGLIFKYQEIAPQVLAHLNKQSFVLPAIVFVPAMVGWIYQHHNATAKPGGGGGGGGGGSGKK